MYTEKNYPTKKAFLEDFLAGKQIHVFQPGPFPAKTDGTVSIEGPHYPQPHKWYASVVIAGGIVVSVKGAPKRKPAGQFDSLGLKSSDNEGFSLWGAK